VPLVKALTRRLNLDADDAAAVEFLVEHHLLLSHTAERRDIEDPKTVERFAAVARYPAWLTMLYLLTCADIRAVGPGVWTPWRGALLRELFARTRTRLAGRFPKPPRRAAVALRIVQALADGSYATAASAHLQAMSDRYVRTTSPQRMAAHLRLIDRLREEPVVSELFHYPDLGASDFVVVTRDVPRLFALILAAQIETRADGLAVDTFHVNDPAGDPVLDEARWDAVAGDLRRALAGEASVEQLFATRRRPVVAGAGPVRVAIDNSISDTHTVVEVKAPDRVGLLYLVTRTFADEAVNIATAKIATDRDQALDVFYVTDAARGRIEAPARLDALREAIVRALRDEESVRAGAV
jgi:[protein-PII] uridylyltransferase